MFNVKATQLMKAQALLVLSTLCGCEADLRTPNSGIGELQVPSREDFTLVSDAMQLKCGSLDCHGQIGRNLRLFGHYGLRLADADNPYEPFMSTPEEYEASYLSVTGLEPETMSKVIKKELTPIQLALVRKPREIEKHKGHHLMTQGDALDRCLVGWLLAAFDPDSCTTVITSGKPEPDAGSDGGS
jgi:hypothetical protein